MTALVLPEQQIDWERRSRREKVAKQTTSNEREVIFGIASFSSRQTQTTGWVWGGTDRLFRVTAMQQQEVNRNLTINGINRGTTESTVNTAFLSFLNAISDLGPQPAQRLWTLAPKKLVADFSTPQRERGLVAYIDGQLKDVVTCRILALVECKDLGGTIIRRKWICKKSRK
ncbi:hypothetical protein AtubIFM56815_005652 [Aspergillus tubingensis]|uniref:Uncharacterized protein n=1 Tax=Aspergillus tubingensis TaxID=5068 RepID=A0A9W6AZ67_ASPTU|nr:hypothetical protein AtubIFM56815_005652 [Aspergillus tubingensis]